MAPAARFLEVAAPALVIGSVQSLPSADAGAEIEVARRRSGGGAVLLRPGEALWADVFVPSGDSLWDDDVGRAAHWLGETWALALGDLGVTASWHDGGLVPGPYSHLACFGGLGPGEVTVADRKVVGISQRRTRAGAQFQCAALLAWDPGALVALLALDAGARSDATHQLTDNAAALPVSGVDLEAALLARLAER